MSPSFYVPLGSRQVLIKSFVGLGYELAIKSLLAAARLVSRDQKDRVAFRVEGEGDALFEPDGARLWAGHGLRTLEDSHRQLTDLWGVEVVSLRLVDPRFYHLDTCFCPLSNGDVMYFAPAFDRESQSKIEARYSKKQRICVSESDALQFACNAVNVGPTILLNHISAELYADLESRGFQIVQVELTEFLKAGGAAKCLVLRLSEMNVTHRA